MNPPPADKLADMLRKGYLVRIGNKYAYTEKAIKAFREKAPTSLIEVIFSILDRKIKFVMIGKPEGLHPA